MIAIDEYSLICDLAETYNIYNYRTMPPLQVAIFVCGLSPNSRIMRKVNNMKLPTNETLLVGIVDRLSMILEFGLNPHTKIATCKGGIVR